MKPRGLQRRGGAGSAAAGSRATFSRKRIDAVWLRSMNWRSVDRGSGAKAALPRSWKMKFDHVKPIHVVQSHTSERTMIKTLAIVTAALLPLGAVRAQAPQAPKPINRAEFLRSVDARFKQIDAKHNGKL